MRHVNQKSNHASYQVVHLNNNSFSSIATQIDLHDDDEEYAEDVSGKFDFALPLEGPIGTVKGNMPERVIRTGTFAWVDWNKMFGELIQDEQYHNIGPYNQERVFFHFTKVYPEIRMNEDIRLDPRIDITKRVQFQARKHPTKDGVLDGFNIRYEDGEDIPLIHWSGSIVLIKKAKAKLGHDIFNVLNNPLEKDAEQIAKKVDKTIATCKLRVDWARKQITNPGKVKMERKGRLGTEIYDLLMDIVMVDNIQLRTAEACRRCHADLSSLGLVNDESTDNREDECHTFDEFFENREEYLETGQKLAALEGKTKKSSGFAI